MAINPFESLDSRLQNIESMLLQFKPVIQESPKSKVLRTRKEAATYFGITLPTLHKWTKEGKVKAQRIGSRIRFYQSDLEKALQTIKAN